jgi:hypothetical protein
MDLSAGSNKYTNNNDGARMPKTFVYEKVQENGKGKKRETCRMVTGRLWMR